MDDGMRRVSCVLPAYNEDESLPLTVAEWAEAFERCTVDYEIIVVDDGSTDDTVKRLRELQARHERLRVITQGVNLGYGAAIVRGFAAAAFPLLFFTDSDGQYDPADFEGVLAHADEADVVVGYRMGRSDPAIRHVLSRGYNFLARHVVGVDLRDINCAFKLLHRDAFRRLGLEATGFAINAELALCARLARMRVVELPVRHRPRHAGRSKVRALHVVRALWGLAWLHRRCSPTRRSAIRSGAFASGGPLRAVDGNRDTAASAR